MGFSKTTASWFSVLTFDKAEKLGSPQDFDDDFDAMEQGFARALARDEVKPEAEEAPRRTMRVARSDDRLRHVLYNEAGDAVLEAVVGAQSVQIFAAGVDLKVAADVPVFTMTHDKEKRNWTISSRHCEKCAYRAPSSSCKDGQTLGLVRHMKEMIGEGVAMCMDVDIPDIGADGMSTTWCPMCKGAGEDRIELSSMRPKWNEKLKSLTMDFNGRVEAASAKNFQLCMDDKVVLLYGKKKSGDFALDFEYPMSPAQAFTIALTTMYWT